MTEYVPEAIDVRPESLAICGFEEGGAGQIQAFMEAKLGAHVACFVNPFEAPPDIDVERARLDRDASQFDYPTATSFKGRPLITARDWPAVLRRFGITRVICTQSDKRQRLAFIEQARTAGLELVNAIHPTALIMEDAIIGENVIILANAVVGYRAEVHDGAFIHIGTQLDHHTVVRRGAVVGPSAILAGNVTVGECAHIFTGVSVKNKTRIGDDTIIGAGAAVVTDIPANVTAVGVPARVIKQHSRAG